MTPVIPPRARADAVVRLRAAGCVFAEDEAAALAAAAADEVALGELVRRRADGEPLEQVVGHVDFCGVRVRLRPGVFVPRVRTELLVRLAVAAATGHRAGPPILVDLCCGSGALAAAVAHLVPGVVVHAADLDPVAVGCARDNLAAFGGRAYQGDLFGALPVELRGRIDVLLANVPYVPTEHLPLLPAEARLHEPRLALDGGADGLDVARAVATAAPAWLAPGGIVLMETTADQSAAAVAALTSAGLLAETATDDDLEATAVLGRRLTPCPAG
jgi:release factor glutamine methyltransferase